MVDEFKGQLETIKAWRHHPQYVFNDGILPMGAAHWVTLTEQCLR